MPKAPELSYINFMPSPKLWLFKFAGVPDYKIPPPPPPPPLSKTQGSAPDFKWQGWSKDFQFWDFLGIQNNLKFRGQCPRITAAWSFNCFYFSCYFNAFWKFLRFRNSAWKLLEVFFAPIRSPPSFEIRSLLAGPQEIKYIPFWN